jgi:hypothetical protein
MPKELCDEWWLANARHSAYGLSTHIANTARRLAAPRELRPPAQPCAPRLRPPVSPCFAPPAPAPPPAQHSVPRWPEAPPSAAPPTAAAALAPLPVRRSCGQGGGAGHGSLDGHAGAGAAEQWVQEGWRLTGGVGPQGINILQNLELTSGTGPCMPPQVSASFRCTTIAITIATPRKTHRPCRHFQQHTPTWPPPGPQRSRRGRLTQNSQPRPYYQCYHSHQHYITGPPGG